MAKPRRQTYTMDQYLSKMKDADIRSDQDVQRLSGQWDKCTINELIVTVLTDNYIPPIILGEEKIPNYGSLTDCNVHHHLCCSDMETIRSHPA